MKILVITDLEGVNGVLNFRDWCVPEGKRNETACRFLTEEVNSVVNGFIDGGADEVVVWDGHGSGGSIRGELLDNRVSLWRGGSRWPDLFDGFDAAAFVGQHAMAGAQSAHLAHTQTQECVYFRINHVDVGEYGQLTLAAAERNVPVIFASGDDAFAEEALAFTPAVTAIAVKQGLCDASKDTSVSADDLFDLESDAVHYPRGSVLQTLYDGAVAAMENFNSDPTQFVLKKPLTPPYTVQALYRSPQQKLIPEVGQLPVRLIRTQPSGSVIKVLQEFYSTREWSAPDGDKIREIQ